MQKNRFLTGSGQKAVCCSECTTSDGSDEE